MANEEHLRILRQGAAVWDPWRHRNPAVTPDLSNMSWLGLKNRVKVAVEEANIFVMGRTVDLGGMDLESANLRKADLRGVDLTGANLDHADISFSRMGYTTLAATDLSKVKGLETVAHEGPSTIGIDTVYRSQGNIPEIFLRGSGVGDDFISLIRSLAGSIQFYSCFISYSGQNQEFATRIHADLQDNGVRCWFAPNDMQSGKKLHEQIDDAIRMHERLLLILSPDSVNSEWVKTEMAKARKRELKEQKRVLFPIRINISFKELQD